MQISLARLAAQCDASVLGDETLLISGVGSLECADADQLSLYTDRRYRQAAVDSKAAVYLTRPDLAGDLSGNCLIVENPLLALATILRLFQPAIMSETKSDTGIKRSAETTIDPTALVNDSVQIGAGARIASNVVVSAGARLGDGVVLGPGCVIQENVELGRGTQIDANVTVYHDCTLGQHCHVSSGAVIGADGFGFAEDTRGDDARWVAIMQVGRVRIGDNVHIGANTTIDRGSLEDTVIGDDVIIDNLVQIAHNVRIGRHTAIAGCAAIAGSTRIGENCKLGGRASIIGHLNICDDVVVFADSLVTRSIERPGIYSSSMPAMPVAQWRKLLARFRRLRGRA